MIIDVNTILPLRKMFTFELLFYYKDRTIEDCRPYKKPNYPAVYTLVTNYIEWIQNAVNEEIMYSERYKIWYLLGGFYKLLP